MLWTRRSAPSAGSPATAATNAPAAGSASTTPQARIAVVVTLGFFVALGMLMFAPVRIELKDPLLLMLGALIGNFNSIVSYFFGTTTSSAKKDDTIHQLTSSVVAPAAPAPAKVSDMQVAADNVTVTPPAADPPPQPSKGVSP